MSGWRTSLSGRRRVPDLARRTSAAGNRTHGSRCAIPSALPSHVTRLSCRQPPFDAAFQRAASRHRVFSLTSPTILDDYVLRDFFVYLGMIIATFLMLLRVFTLFELLGDILRNHASSLGGRRISAECHPILSLQHPASRVLLAVLITFGLMERSNEVTAIKATGISIYRVIVPVLVMLIAAGRESVLLRPVLPAAHQQTSGRAAEPDQGQARANIPTPRPQVDFRTSIPTSTTTSSSMPTAISSPTSRYSSSIPSPSALPTGYMPNVPTGPTSRSAGSLSKGGNAQSARRSHRQLSPL